jgi:hypothetical protein
MAIARYHERKNDTSKTASAYRRILDLDPGNEAAMKYFSRGKADCC